MRDFTYSIYPKWLEMGRMPYPVVEVRRDGWRYAVIAVDDLAKKGSLHYAHVYAGFGPYEELAQVLAAALDECKERGLVEWEVQQ